MDFLKTTSFNLILALVYWLSGQLLVSVKLPPIDATPFWLSSGIAVGSVLVWGYKLIPGAFLGALALGLSVHGSEPSMLLLSFFLGLQSVLLVFLARLLVVRYKVWPDYLVVEKNILTFFTLIAVVAPILPAALVAITEVWLEDIVSQHFSGVFWLWWLGLVIGITGLTPVLLTLFAKPRKIWHFRIYSVALPLLFLLTAVVTMLVVAKNRDLNLTESRFESQVELINASIDSEILYHQSMLKALRSFFRGSEDVSEQEFTTFIEQFAPHQHGLQVFGGLALQPDRDTPGKRTLHLNYLQDYSNNANTLTLQRLKDRDLCVMWQHDKVCQQSALTFNQTEQLRTLLCKKLNGSDCLLALLPIQDEQVQAESYILYLYSSDMFAGYLKQQSLLDYTLTDLRSDQVLYSKQHADSVLTHHLGYGFSTSREIKFDDQQWQLTLFPSAVFLGKYANWAYYGVLVAALIIISLAAAWLLTITGRYNLVEHQVAKQTKALRRHTEMLEASEKKYRSLVESIQDEYFIYSHDTQGYFQYVSPSIETILGYSQQAFLTHFSTYLPDTEHNRQVTELTQRTLSGEKMQYEVEILSQSGQIHTLALTESPMFDKSGQVIGVEGIARDVTEFKASQLELEKLSLAVQNSPNAIIILDKSGRIEYVNPKFTQLTGYDKDEAKMKWPDLLNSGHNDPGIYQEIWATIQAGDEWRGELQNRKKNGELYWAQELIAPMVNEEGEVTHYISTQIDITEARRLNEEKSYQASHDLLTGLLNRREFDLRLDRAIHAAKRNLTEHALCFLDLDQFKQVNDTCGHTAGDELLRQIGQLLQSNVRSRDTVARLGGDEFAILMEHCAIDQAYQACEQVLAMLSDFRFHWQDYTFTVGGSIGLTIIDQMTVDSNEALSTVDTACYAAKDAGRNRIEVLREDSERLKQRRGEIQWSTEISEALDDDRFLLYVQAIKSLNNSAASVNYEVLVRMEHRDGRISPPSAFLPAAERYNSIIRIDRWVVSHTLAWIKAHAAQLNQVGTFSINLSGLTLSDDGMLNFIVNAIEKADIPPEKIKFEITETAAIANIRAATLFIEKLRERGILFSLDDFGSGLSSFAYLKNMKVDALKIDGMFVRDMLNDPLDYEMVKSINEIGHVMGLETIAEFVESEAILNKLSEIGVDYVQGYAIGKPVPIADILTASTVNHDVT